MSHLDYYREHGISPVRYAQAGHAERRASLYRQLRILPQVFRGADVLEVAAGSGQNAQYIASLNPALLVLVEPNPAGIADISKIEMRAEVVQCELENFHPDRQFDIVICENWLGSAKRERDLIKRLAGFVRKNGLLLMTVISETGLIANGMRRQMAERLIGPDHDENVALLVRAFGPHLATLKDMTRSHEDWVKDNMLNPAWQGIGLTLPMLVEEIGIDFDILGTAPDVISDWRWWKSLHGDSRMYNFHALEQMRARDRWFIDYRVTRDHDLLESMAALREAHRLLEKSSITVEDVAAMSEFKYLFGRETVHVSFVKR